VRRRLPAVLLLFVCVLAGAGWHADEAALAVAAHAPGGTTDVSLGLTPYDTGLPTVQAGGAAQSTAGSAAVLNSGSWPVRRARAARFEAHPRPAASGPGREVAPARAPPAASTR
jgi:hypothetical protein